MGILCSHKQKFLLMDKHLAWKSLWQWQEIWCVKTSLFFVVSKKKKKKNLLCFFDFRIQWQLPILITCALLHITCFIISVLEFLLSWMSQTGHSQGSLSGEILLLRKKGKHKRGLISFQVISQVHDQKWIMSFGFSSKDVHVKILLIFNNSSTQNSLKISSKHGQVLNAGEAFRELILPLCYLHLTKISFEKYSEATLSFWH